MTDIATLRGWPDRYERAWRSNDPADIADLFTEDAVYRWRPWDTPADGAASRAEIVEAWLREPDEPGTWTLECEPLAVNGSLGIARCITRYAVTDLRPDGPTYHNLWLVELDDDGRCRDFTEYFMENPKAPPLR
jgi:ketosteroid isomerase-like protein